MSLKKGFWLELRRSSNNDGVHGAGGGGGGGKKRERGRREKDDEQVQQQPMGMPIIEGSVDEKFKAKRQTQTKNKHALYLSSPSQCLLKTIKYLSQQYKHLSIILNNFLPTSTTYILLHMIYI